MTPALGIVVDHLLSPCVDDLGRPFGYCNVINSKKWIEDNGIPVPTSYGEGFHRDDFEDD